MGIPIQTSMATAMTTAMTTRAPNQTQLLTLAQWFSPTFPVGSFSYSHGLEWTIDARGVTDVTSLGAWVREVLEFGGGWSDAVFLSVAYGADTDAVLARVNDHARAFAPSKERLFETVEQGAAFCRAVTPIWGQMPAHLVYPVAVGAAARHLDLPKQACLSMFLHAFASNLVTVGMRLVPLGQSEGQALIHDLAPLCERLADAALQADLTDLSGTAFMADIASMKHETQYSRTFRT